MNIMLRRATRAVLVAAIAVDPGHHRIGIEPEVADEVLLTLFRRCAAQPECQAAYPRLQAEYEAVLARLHETPFRIRFPASDLGPGGELLVDDRVMRPGLTDLWVSHTAAGSDEVCCSQPGW